MRFTYRVFTLKIFVLIRVAQYFQKAYNQAVVLLCRVRWSPIFVPEVDWCSTNINQESKSIEKNYSQSRKNQKQIRCQSTSYFFIQYL